MFREEATPVPCPFRGPMTFSYNRGHGTCSVPVSNVDTCTDDSRLLFRYQACPDISASESAGKFFFSQDLKYLDLKVPRFARLPIYIIIIIIILDLWADAQYTWEKKNARESEKYWR